MKKIILPAILALTICGAFYWLFFANPAPRPTKLNSDAVAMAQKMGDLMSGQAEVNDTDPNSKAINKTNNQIIMGAILHTSMGDIVIEFDGANTPNTAANFVKLAANGFYDGTKFHRVIKGFMNQGGDPISKDDSQMEMWGRGGPGYQFADEIKATNSNDAGTIAMANSGPNTNGSQFFINVAPNHGLDTKHTVFGRVVSGADVSMAINAVETDSSDRPITPVVIKSITLLTK